MNDLRALPVNELGIAAVCVVIGFNPEIGDNGAIETDMDILDQKLWDAFRPSNKPNRCGCCGHALKYACAAVHAPTGNGYWVGRDCASNILRLQKFEPAIAARTIALAQRLACNKHEADFLAAHPDVMSTIAWCRLPYASKIAKDMLEKMRRFGNLSEAQIGLLEKIRTRDEERRAAATGTALVGRHTVEGVVVSSKTFPSVFEKYSETTKITVAFNNGTRAYGTAPTYSTSGKEVYPRKGDRVKFTATFEASQKDPLFGFWKRPTKFSILVHSAEDVLKWYQEIFPRVPGLADMPPGEERNRGLWTASSILSKADQLRFVYHNFDASIPQPT